MSVIQYISPSDIEYHIMFNPTIETFMSVVDTLNKYDKQREQIIAEVFASVSGLPKTPNCITTYVVYQIIRHVKNNVSMDPVAYYAGYQIDLFMKNQTMRVFNIVHLHFASRASKDSRHLAQGIIMQYNPEIQGVFYNNERPAAPSEIGASTVYKRQLYSTWGKKVTIPEWQRYRDSTKIAEYLIQASGKTTIHFRYTPAFLEHLFSCKNFRAYAKITENTGEISDLIIIRVKRGKNEKHAVLRYFQNITIAETFLTAKGFNYVEAETNKFFRPEHTRGKMYFIQRENHQLLFTREATEIIPHTDSEILVMGLV